MLLVNLDPRDARPLYLQIMDEVRRALVVGTLRAEDPLPSVRELAGAAGRESAHGVAGLPGAGARGRDLRPAGTGDVRRARRPRATAGERRACAGWRSARVLEARRNGLGVEELVKMIRKVAAEEEEDTACVTPPPATGAGEKRSSRVPASELSRRTDSGGHPRLVEAIRPRDRARRRRPARSRGGGLRPGRRERRGQEHHAQGADEPGARRRRHARRSSGWTPASRAPRCARRWATCPSAPSTATAG